MKPVTHNQPKVSHQLSASSKKVGAPVPPQRMKDLFDSRIRSGFDLPDRSSRVPSNPLLDAISAIEDYCDYDDFSRKMKQTDIHIDSDSYIGYVGSNSIDSGYKSPCSTPELVDNAYYTTTSLLEPSKRLSLTSRESVDSLAGVSAGAPKPRIAMGTRVISRQNTSSDVRRRNDSGFDDKAPNHDCSTKQTTACNSPTRSTRESKVDSVRRSSLRLKSRKKSSGIASMIRPRSASIGSSRTETTPHLDRSESNDVLQCNFSSTTATLSDGERSSPLLPPTRRRRSPSPRAGPSRFWHCQTRLSRAPALLPSEKSTSSRSSDIINNATTQICRTEHIKRGNLNDVHPQRSATSNSCRTDNRPAQLIGHKIEINGTNAPPPALAISTTRSRIPTVFHSTFPHRPTQIVEKVCQPPTGSTRSSSQREERNRESSTSANARPKFSHTRDCIQDLIDRCDKKNDQTRSNSKHHDIDVYHTYEEVMYGMMRGVHNIPAAKPSPHPPPLPERPILMKREAQLSSKCRSSDETQANLIPATVHSRLADSSKHFTVHRGSEEASRCHQEPKQRHNLYSLLHSARDRRCFARSLEKHGPSNEHADDEYGFVAMKRA